MLRYFGAWLVLVLLTTPAWADSTTIGPFGVNRVPTGLTGAGVSIGQVEDGRSHDPDTDTRAALVTNPFNIDPPGEDERTSNHATAVAGVMIAYDEEEEVSRMRYEGVAPGALLYSGAFPFLGGDQPVEIATNRLARIDDSRIRAINFSFGRLYNQFEDTLNGNIDVTQFVDWSADEEDWLPVVAWGNDGETEVEFQALTENYNGITVASSTYVAPGGADTNAKPSYDRWSPGNLAVNNQTDAAGLRTSIDLIAPGFNVRTLIPALVGDQDNPSRNGASLAAPHVTGAVAILHEHYQQQIDANNPRFDPRRRTNSVMKAVLMNSADKLDGVHDSYRTIYDSDGDSWIEHPAFVNSGINLHPELGAGHLNVAKAVAQLAPGEYSGGEVPAIGWDWGRSGGGGDQFEYEFDVDFAEGEYFAATLAWNRVVEPIFTGSTWNVGDQFFNHGTIGDEIANFNLYLMKAGENDLTQAVSSSTVLDDNLEHIFFEIEEAGAYKLVVTHVDSTFYRTEQTDFGLAWWYGSAGLTAPLPGDYDGDGNVDQDDKEVWDGSYGENDIQPGSGADGNGDGIVDAADYTVWRDAYDSAAVAVPEPSSVWLCWAATAIAFGYRPRARKIEHASTIFRW